MNCWNGEWYLLRNIYVPEWLKSVCILLEVAYAWLLWVLFRICVRSSCVCADVVHYHILPCLGCVACPTSERFITLSLCVKHGDTNQHLAVCWHCVGLLTVV